MVAGKYFGGWRKFIHDFVYGYGSFMFFTRPSANLLLLACTMMRPWVGLLGIIGGVSTLLCRRWLGLVMVAGGLEVANGILAGLLVGYFFGPDWRTAVLAVCAGPFAVLVSAAMGAALLKHRLPLLSGSFVVVGGLLLAVGRALALPWGVPAPPPPIEWLPMPLAEFLKALGGIYLTRTPAGGALVLAALALSSRTLAVLAAMGFILAELALVVLLVPVDELAGSSAASAAIMAAIMTGGLFTTPSLRAFGVAAFSAVCATVVSLSLFNALWFLALPALSLPFLLTTWLVMYALRPERGAQWRHYWGFPALPERNLEAARQAEARGLSPFSIPLKAPFAGTWTVYQGYDGEHTHKVPWEHAIDFHRLVDGRACRGGGERLEDYFCFGLSVRSPAGGRVVAACSDLPDNPPGEVDVINNWGNHVLIAIASGDYVLLAHLRRGSVTVKVGDDVVPGQPLGQCGNSGRSPHPHLHLHVQSGFALGSSTRPFHLSGVCIEVAGGRRFDLNAVPAEGDLVSAPVVSEALRRGLHMPIARRLTYRAAEPDGRVRDVTIEVDLDPTNQFRLVTEGGAAVSLAETDSLIALYSRSGPPDDFLDGFVLANGYIPLIDIEAEWHDVPPTSLLPLPRLLRGLAWLLPALVSARSRYRKEWDTVHLVWRHSGEHSLCLAGTPVWRCRTDAMVPEGGSISSFSLTVGDRVVLAANLASVGIKGDTGVPGWDVPIGKVV
jgi:urea transporter